MDFFCSLENRGASLSPPLYHQGRVFGKRRNVSAAARVNRICVPRHFARDLRFDHSPTVSFVVDCVSTRTHAYRRTWFP